MKSNIMPDECGLDGDMALHFRSSDQECISDRYLFSFPFYSRSIQPDSLKNDELKLFLQEQKERSVFASNDAYTY
jgi:hypothetical protein